jgi:hypothetical protein
MTAGCQFDRRPRPWRVEAIVQPHRSSKLPLSSFKARTGHICLTQIYPGQIGAAKIAAAKARIFGPSAGQIRLPEVSAVKLCGFKVCAPQVRIPKISSEQPCPQKAHASQVGASQNGALETSVPEVGARQLSVTEQGSAQIDRYKPEGVIFWFICTSS